MKCMHCRIEFHAEQRTFVIGEDRDNGWVVMSFGCPACKRLNLFLSNCLLVETEEGTEMGDELSRIAIRPLSSSRPPCPTEVPASLAGDYGEACMVLPHSPKASAAMSRRCLQNLLRETANVKHGNLNDEIQEVISKGGLPSHLSGDIDAVRLIGNFAAHPMKSNSTGEVLDVEPHEADWNLDVLEALFDFYFVQPAILAKKRAALNAKLAEAGKPPMK